jgi:hypothetical protein
MDIDYTPDGSDALRLTIDLTSTTYAFDVPRSFLTIQGSEEGLIIDFISEETGGVLTGHAITYSALYDMMREMTRNRKETMERHPCRLQLVDGGGKE